MSPTVSEAAPATTSDAGLFGPQSITWRIMGDPMHLVAGLRGLYLQALHPAAMAGVARHSDYRVDPWGRLQRTGAFLDVATYGTRAEAEAAGVRVQRVHTAVRGHDPEAQVDYDATDPALLLWVHAGYIASTLDVYRRSGGPLADGEADVYVAEQVRAAQLVGLDPAIVPSSERALIDYLDGVRPVLRSTPAARSAARFGVVPPMPLWVQLATPARVAWAGVSWLAFSMLPRWARRMYGIPVPLPTTDLGADVAARALRATLLAIPEPIRSSPQKKRALARLA
jgi:uncharacterized protein (DUF2236 family)